MPDSDNHGAVRIGDLVVDANARSVTRDGREIDLPRLSFDLLLALIEAAPGPVSGDELMARVWNGVVVSPATISKRVELLRQALEVRFGTVPASLLEKVQQCQDLETLRGLHKQALTATSPEDIQF